MKKTLALHFTAIVMPNLLRNYSSNRKLGYLRLYRDGHKLTVCTVNIVTKSFLTKTTNESFFFWFWEFVVNWIVDHKQFWRIQSVSRTLHTIEILKLLQNSHISPEGDKVEMSIVFKCSLRKRYLILHIGKHDPLSITKLY